MNAETMNARYDRLLAKASTAGMISDPPSDEYRELCALAVALNRPIRWKTRIVRLYGDEGAPAAGVR